MLIVLLIGGIVHVPGGCIEHCWIISIKIRIRALVGMPGSPRVPADITANGRGMVGLMGMIRGLMMLMAAATAAVTVNLPLVVTTSVTALTGNCVMWWWTATAVMLTDASTTYLIIAAGVIVSAVLPFSGSVALAVTRRRYHHRLLLRGQEATAARAVADHLDSLALPTRRFIHG